MDIMKHPFDILNSKIDASLIFTPCPGIKETTLEDAVLTLKEAGAAAIITLMPEAEMEKFDAQSLPEICQQNGVLWFHLPIEDDSVPSDDFHAIFKKQKPLILEALEQNQKIAIHCRGGSGRTGFMGAILLLELGLDWGTVLEEVLSLRPKALQKQAQLEYLKHRYNIEI